MALWAISDLHVDYGENRELVAELAPRPDDWLVLAGDVGSSLDHLRWTFERLRPRFAGIAWVPGNHELWTVTENGLRGEALYRALVEVCREYGVATPEDPFPVCEAGGERVVLAPLFALYDYSFREPGLTKQQALERARRSRSLCADESLLHPDPHPSREEWCRTRVAESERRLAAVDPALRTVLVSHWPLRRDTVRLPALPDFAPWCGTELTEDWHVRFRAAAVLNGHLHVPGTLWRDDVPHMEVSLGYPRQWQRRSPDKRAPREVVPGPAPAAVA